MMSKNHGVILFLFLFLFFFHLRAFSQELVVYTSRKEHLVKGIFEQYTRKTGVSIKYKTGKAAALIQILKAEASHSPADIFMTVDAGNLWYATHEKLLAPVSSPILQAHIPDFLKDKKNRWFGFSIRARTIAYNFKQVKETELSTYEDLADPKWKKRLCLRTSKKVYNQSLVAMLIYHLGHQKTKEVVKGWVENTVEIFSNDTAVLKAIASGQCDVGIVNSYYYGHLMKKESELPLKLFWPNQKSYGVHINISGAGIVKSSKNKEQARKFLEWLSGKEAQQSLAKVNLEYPASRDVPLSPETSKWGTFHSNTRFHLSYAGQLQKQAIKLMQEVRYK